MGFSLSKAFKLPKLSDVVKNPVQTLLRGDLLPAAAGVATLPFGGVPGAIVASQLARPAMNSTVGKLVAPAPSAQTFSQEPRDLQDRLIKGQLSAADQYSQGLPNSINEETAAKRAEINDELQSQLRSERASSNAHGMLFSGRRLANEGGLANDASKNLANARASAIQNMMQREQAMYAQPLASRANVLEANTQQQGILDRARQQTEAAKTANMQQGLGLLGQGAGMYAANKWGKTS